MGRMEKQRGVKTFPAGVSWGFIIMGWVAPILADASAPDATCTPHPAPDPLEHTLATVRECMARAPAPWPQQWQDQYVDAIRRGLAGDPNRAGYAEKLEIARSGFARYWGKTPVAGLTQAQYEVLQAEMQWYCETLMAEDLPSASEKTLLQRQFRELCDYATEYLTARFPFVLAEYVQESKEAALREFDEDLAAPLVPIFRRPFSEDQLCGIKANWGRLYERWHFIWQEVRYGGGDAGDLSDPGTIENHSHYRFARRCLIYLPRLFWLAGPRPPGYVADVIGKLNAGKAERGRLNKPGADAERDLARRSSNQVEQVEARRFFQGIREHGRLKHTAERPPVDAAADAMVSAWAKGDAAILDRLPFGRTYSKETSQQGHVVWRMAKATVPMERVRVTIRPVAPHNASARSEVGDPNTLGRWSGVPEVYRRYWSLRDRSLNLRRKANIADAEQLHADITSALRETLPDDVNAPLRELLFHVSLHTGSDEAIRSSAIQYFSAYVRLAQEPVERIVIELGRIGQDLRVAWPEDRIRDFIRPLLESLIGPQAFTDPGFVQHYILSWLQVQGPTWSWYRQLVRETVQDATGMTLEPATCVERGSARPNGSTNIGDSEPNDDAASTNNREQKGLLPHDERE